MQSYQILRPQPSLSEVCRQMHLYPGKHRDTAPEAATSPTADPNHIPHHDTVSSGTAAI